MSSTPPPSAVQPFQESFAAIPLATPIELERPTDRLTNLSRRALDIILQAAKVPSTVGELYEIEQTRCPCGPSPDGKTLKRVFQKLFPPLGADAPASAVATFMANTEQVTFNFFKKGMAFDIDREAFLTVTPTLISGYQFQSERLGGNDPRFPPARLTPIAQGQISARVIDTSLDPTEPLDRRKLLMVLETITNEHRLLTHMAQMLRSHVSGLILRRRLKEQGGLCASIPGIPLSLLLQAPTYPNDIPWPILYLRCRLARITRNLSQTDASFDRLRTLVRAIIEAKKKFPAHTEILEQMVLEAQCAECHVRTAGNWGKLFATLSTLDRELEEAGPFIEWPLALTMILKSTRSWTKRALDYTNSVTARIQQPMEREDYRRLTDQWDRTVSELATLFADAAAAYQERRNTITTRAIFETAHKKTDDYFTGKREGKKRASIVRGVSRIGEFIPKEGLVFPLFGTDGLSLLKPELLFATDLTIGADDLSYLVSEQERRRIEERSQRPSSAEEFLPRSLLQKPSPPPVQSKKKKHPPREPHATEKPAEPLPQTPPPPALPIAVGDGPAPYQYAWSVRKWTFSDPFVSEPSYRDRALSKEVQNNIRFEHDFAHVIHKLCFVFGAPFVQHSSSNIIYALPGEVYWDDGSYKKMIFEIIYDAKTQTIFHAGAKEKSPLQVVQRYQEQGCFYDGLEDEEIVIDTTDPKQTLPDDGSRITSFSLEDRSNVSAFIEVRDEKYKATCRLYPFPVD